MNEYICPACGRISEHETQCKHIGCVVSMRLNHVINLPKYCTSILQRGSFNVNSFSTLGLSE